jgi:hypothetical protein
VYVGERALHLTLEAFEAPMHAPQLVLQEKHTLDAGKIESDLRCQLLDQA